MKEPWEVYSDEFWREFSRRARRAESGHRQISTSEIEDLSLTVATATAQHLVDLGWRQDDANDLLRLFYDSMNRIPTRPDLANLDPKAAMRLSLKNAYTDYELRRRQL